IGLGAHLGASLASFGEQISVGGRTKQLADVVFMTARAIGEAREELSLGASIVRRDEARHIDLVSTSGRLDLAVGGTAGLMSLAPAGRDMGAGE
ncbi:unnamed protein product, partial [Ilex paraguariensis]